MLLKLGLALCIVAAAPAASCPSDIGDKVLKCTTDFTKGFSADLSVEDMCRALKGYLCCTSNVISTCDANSQKLIKDQYKAQMKQMSGSVKALSQCNLDLPNALDQAQTRCAGAKWVEATGSSPPRAAMSGILCLCMFLVLKVFL